MSRVQFRVGTWDAWLAVVAWGLGLVAVWLITRVSPAQYYELSIYEALPPMFLFSLQASLALHIFLAARTSFRQHWANTAGPTALSGIAGVVFDTAVVMLLPYLRGYIVVTGDLSSHVAHSAEIASTSNIGVDVFYPAPFSLVQIIHAATGLESRAIWFFGAVGMYIIYVLLCIMVAKRLLADDRAALFAGLAAAIPLSGAYLRTMMPASMSVQLLPLVFYLYARSRRKEGQGFNLLLVLILILFPFIHPLTSLMSILWLALLEVARWWLSHASFWRSLIANPPVDAGFHAEPLMLNASLILAITWFAWLSSFTLWYMGLREVAAWLGREATTQLASLKYLASRSRLSVAELIELVLKQENGVIIYTGLALASSVLCYFLVRRRKLERRLLVYLVPLYVLLITSTLAAGSALVGPWRSLDFYRFSRFLVPWATLVLAAVPLLAGLVGSWARRLVAAAVICAFILAALGGFWAMHPSPFVFQPNDQMTARELSCMAWVYRDGDGHYVLGVWGLNRQAESALGYSAAKSMPSLQWLLPEHFGYTQGSSVADILGEPAYFLITEYDRATVLDLWASVEKYTEEDFRRLEEDPAAVLLYTNGGCEIWAVHPEQESDSQ